MITGTVNIPATATLQIASGTLSGSGTINNAGAATYTGTMSISTFNNSGSFNDQTDNTIGGSAFNNSGSFTKSAGTSIAFHSKMNNTGSVNDNAGTLTFSNVVQQSGTKLTGGVWTVSGTGDLVFPSGNITRRTTVRSRSAAPECFRKIGGLASYVGSFSLLAGDGLTTSGNLQSSGTMTVEAREACSRHWRPWTLAHSTSVLVVQIGSTSPSGFGQLSACTGAATLGGTLGVSGSGQLVPTSQIGNSFAFLSATSVSGSFARVTSVDSGYTFSVDLSTPGIAKIVVGSLPGG